MRERRFFPPPLCNGVQNLPGGIDIIEDIFKNCMHTVPYRTQQKNTMELQELVDSMKYVP